MITYIVTIACSRYNLITEVSATDREDALAKAVSDFVSRGFKPYLPKYPKNFSNIVEKNSKDLINTIR